MELLQAITTRRSARRYSREDVPLAVVEELLGLAACAPSACDKRAWRNILIQDRQDLEWLYQRGASGVLRHVNQALLVCYESRTDNSEWSDNLQSAAAYIAYFQLIAHDRGIGSCWICHLPPKNEVRRHFSVPYDYEPVAVVTFGYYVAGQAPRKPDNSRILALNRWDFAADEKYRSVISAYCRKLLRSFYYALPCRGWLRGVAGRYEKKFDE